MRKQDRKKKTSNKKQKKFEDKIRMRSSALQNVDITRFYWDRASVLSFLGFKGNITGS